jgi:AraC family transcriptional regulator
MAPHSHPHWKICLAVAGVYCDLERGVHRRKGPSSLSVLPPGEAHSSVFPESTRCFHIELDDDWRRELAAVLPAGLGPIYFDSGRVPSLAHRISMEFAATDTASDLLIHGLSLELLAFLGRASDAPRRRAPWVERAASLLRERTCGRVAAAEIAAELGVHPVHLSREFKKHFGVTMGEYLRDFRVRLASEELRSTKSLAEIAAAAGFADQSHFTRIFKRTIGQTPGEFRRRVLS